MALRGWVALIAILVGIDHRHVDLPVAVGVELVQIGLAVAVRVSDPDVGRAVGVGVTDDQVVPLVAAGLYGFVLAHRDSSRGSPRPDRTHVSGPVQCG